MQPARRTKPAQPAQPESGDESSDTVRLVNDYIEKIFGDFPISAELRSEREELLRSDIEIFVGEVLSGGASAAEIEKILYERFGDPEVLREIYLRADSASAVWNDRAGAWALAGLFGVSIVFVAFVKALDFFVSWRLPEFASVASGSASAVLLTLSTMTGIIGYVANWLLSGNRYRIVPFVLVSTVAFLIGGSVRMEFDILERAPQLRTHVLVSVAVPIFNLEGQSLIRRYIADFDFTGLPAKFTRARPLVTERQEISSALFRFFWFVVIGVAVGNYYVLSRLADDLAVLGDVV